LTETCIFDVEAERHRGTEDRASAGGVSMGDIVDTQYGNTIAQYPRDIVSEVETPRATARDQQPEATEEEASRSVEEHLGRNIDVTV
jgi:hypothetical protein